MLFWELFFSERAGREMKKPEVKVDQSWREEQRNCGTQRGRVRVGQGQIGLTACVCVEGGHPSKSSVERLQSVWL